MPLTKAGLKYSDIQQKQTSFYVHDYQTAELRDKKMIFCQYILKFSAAYDILDLFCMGRILNEQRFKS